MPAAHQAAMDERGYIFVLPSLGLVDPAGEWVSVKAAITTSAQQRASLALQDPTLNGPSRYHSGEYTIVEAEYEGAVWFLPILQQSEAAAAEDPDVFAVQAQRVPLDAALNIDRIKIPNKTQTICLKPPFLDLDRSINPSAGEPESDAAAGHEEESNERNPWDFARSRPRSASSSSSSESSFESESSSSSSPSAQLSKPSMPQEQDQEVESGEQSEGEEKDAAEVKEQEQEPAVESKDDEEAKEEGDQVDEEETEAWKDGMFDELRSGEVFHNDPWKQQIYYEMLAEALGNNVSINEDANPNIRIKFAPAPDNAYRSMIYAVRAQGDSRPIREEEWKPLPLYATKPGFQRYFVNMGREMGGHSPFSRAAWPPGPAPL